MELAVERHEPPFLAARIERDNLTAATIIPVEDPARWAISRTKEPPTTIAPCHVIERPRERESAYDVQDSRAAGIGGGGAVKRLAQFSGEAPTFDANMPSESRRRHEASGESFMYLSRDFVWKGPTHNEVALVSP
jgi:hypothetical protein